MKKQQKHLPLPVLLLVAFVTGAIGAVAGTYLVSAHGGDANKIHGCKNSMTGILRIIGENDQCRSNETAIDWDKEASGGGSEFVNCSDCTLHDIQVRYDIPTTTNHNFDNALLTLFNAPDTNFSGSTFVDAIIRGAQFQNSNLSNTNFSNANLSATSSNYYSDLTGANLTGANFSNANLFKTILDSANLTNVNFTNASLNYAQGLGGTIRTGVIWSNTICPDSTNSDDNGGTCEGHLNP